MEEPHKYDKVTKQLIYKILSDVSLGMSLNKACKSYNVNINTVRAWMIREPGLHVRYMHAQEARSYAIFDEMEELEDQVLEGKINPKAYRAAAETRKWRLGKMNQKRFGDRQILEHTGKVNVASEIATARRAAIIESVERKQLEREEQVEEADIIEYSESEQQSLLSIPK